MIQNILKNILGLWTLLVFLPFMVALKALWDITNAVLGVIGAILICFVLIGYIIIHPYDAIFEKNYEFTWEILRKTLGKE